MITIRLTRGGANKRPFYHVVVANSVSPRDGRYIERLGFFNPIAQGKEVRLRLDNERVQYWLDKGANTTNRVKQLIKQSQETPVAEEASA